MLLGVFENVTAKTLWMKLWVSILIPAYNAERWIADSINSALAQSWPYKEIIVVDDGSTDGTLAVANKFRSAGVSVIAQSNKGAAAARNAAFLHCRGDYVQWLDADDLLGRDKVRLQIESLKPERNCRILLSGAWGTFYYRPLRARFQPSPLWTDLSPVAWLQRKLRQDCFMQTATWLVSRELSNAAGPWNTTLLGDDDGEYFARVIRAAHEIKFVRSSLVYYRDAGANRLSHVGWSAAKLEAHFRSMVLHIEYLRSMADTTSTREACLRYLQRYMYHFYDEQPAIVKKMECLAAELGGRLTPPRVRWKFYWIQKLLGWKVAKRAQFLLPQVRASFAKQWDKALFKFVRKSAV